MNKSAYWTRKPLLSLVTVLLVLVGLPSLALIQLQVGKHFSSDLIAFLNDENTPAIEKHVEKALTEQLSRFIFVQLSASESHKSLDISFDADGLKEEVSVFLKDHPSTLQMADFGVNTHQLTYIKDHSLELFFPQWMSQQLENYNLSDQALPFEAWLASRVVGELDAFLNQEVSLVYDSLDSDPLLLLPFALKSWSLDNANSSSRDNIQPETLTLRLWTPLNPFAKDNQEALNHCLAALEDRLKSKYPEIEYKHSGAYKIAMESESKIRRDMVIINGLAFLLIAGLLYGLFRRLSLGVWLLLPVLPAVLWGGLAVFIFFGHIHLMAVLIGSILIGVSVDYGIHTFCKVYTHPEDSWQKHRKSLILPLGVSWLSSCLGFSLFLFIPIEPLKQVGLMIPVGLTASLITVYILLPYITRLSQMPLSFGNVRKTRAQPSKITSRAFAVKMIALFVLLALGVSSFFAINHGTWNLFEDTIDRYKVETQAEDELMSLLDKNTSTQLVYSIESTPHAALGSLGALKSFSTLQSSPLSPFLGIDFKNSTHPDFSAPLFIEKLRKELHAQGFEADAFADFEKRFLSYISISPHTAFDGAFLGLMQRMPPSLSTLFFSTEDAYVACARIHTVDTAHTIPAALHIFGGEAHINRVLNAYLYRIAQTGAWAMFAIGLTIAVILRKPLALGLCLLPIACWMIPFCIAIALHEPFGLTGLIGLILGTCMVLDYSAFAFLGEPSSAKQSIRLSSLTSLIVFGLLIFSIVPAIQQLGWVVASMLASGWLLCELKFVNSSN